MNFLVLITVCAASASGHYNGYTFSKPQIQQNPHDFEYPGYPANPSNPKKLSHSEYRDYSVNPTYSMIPSAGSSAGSEKLSSSRYPGYKENFGYLVSYSINPSHSLISSSAFEKHSDSNHEYLDFPVNPSNIQKRRQSELGYSLNKIIPSDKLSHPEYFEYPTDLDYHQTESDSKNLVFTNPLDVMGEPLYQDYEYPSGKPIARQLLPAYTSLLKYYDTAFKELTTHFSLEAIQSLKKSPRNNPLANYIMILISVNYLVDQLVKDRGAYDLFYKKTVEYAIKEAKADPQALIEKIKTRMQLTASQMSLIRELIQQKQKNNCKYPVSRECDLLVDEEIIVRNDPILRKQAELLSALRSMVKNFLVYYSTEFDLAAVTSTAETEKYLLSGAESLKMLVVAGYEARKLSNDISGAANLWADQGLRIFITVAINVIFMVMNQ